MYTAVAGVMNLGFRILHQDLKIPAVLELRPHALGVFRLIGSVVGLREEVFEENRVWNADGFEVLHRRAQGAAVDVLVALELYFANFDLRPFFHHERNADSRRRDRAHLSADGGELASVLRQQLLDDNLRSLQARGVVLALYGKADFALLEAIEHVTVGNRTEAGVIDLPDGRFFLHIDVN